MINIDKNNKNHELCVVLTPNRSISWPWLLRFYIFICGVSLSVALAFAGLGYWLILPFSGLEMLFLGVALYVTCRKIYSQEVITICGDNIRVEKGCEYPNKLCEYDRNWVQVKLEMKGFYRKKTKLTLGSHGKFIEVGSFLSDAEKETLAFELNLVILQNKISCRA